MITVAPADPTAPDAGDMLERLSDTLARLTGSSGRASFDPADIGQPGSVFVLARDAAGSAVGCGAYRPLQPGVAEIKRMYALPGTRGVGSAILAWLEDSARAEEYTAAWLETRAVNERAVRFYEGKGYSRIANFGKYASRPEAVCFGKALAR